MKDKNKINWNELQRGVPIINDSFFVRLDEITGFVYDDRGGYMHEEFCDIDARREIVWIPHDGSEVMPVFRNDMVLVVTTDNRLRLRKARLVDWDIVDRYRVIYRQEN